MFPSIAMMIPLFDFHKTLSFEQTSWQRVPTRIGAWIWYDFSLFIDQGWFPQHFLVKYFTLIVIQQPFGVMWQHVTTTFPKEGSNTDWERTIARPLGSVYWSEFPKVLFIEYFPLFWSSFDKKQTQGSSARSGPGSSIIWHQLPGYIDLNCQ